MKCYEKLICAYAPTRELRRIAVAKKVLNFSTMKTDDQSQYDNCQILASLATATNVHANSHIDDDAFYAIVTAHILNVKYDYRQDIVAYFCFPCHGVAVALRPGDVIMSNPRINHCLSSRCRLADNVITAGM